MWYFSWILGTGLACVFAIVNAVWLELREKPEGLVDLSTEKRSEG